MGPIPAFPERGRSEESAWRGHIFAGGNAHGSVLSPRRGFAIRLRRPRLSLPRGCGTVRNWIVGAGWALPGSRRARPDPPRFAGRVKYRPGFVNLISRRALAPGSQPASYSAVVTTGR